MKVITLQGPQKTGKTTTLKIVIKNFNGTFNEPILQSLKYKHSLTVDWFDAWTVHSFHYNGKEKTVVIITAGDTKDYIESIYAEILLKYRIKFNKELNADLLLVGSHNYYKMNDWLKEISNGDLKVFTRESLDNLSGDTTFKGHAKYLFEHILSVI